jgi:hypothetical protein
LSQCLYQTLKYTPLLDSVLSPALSKQPSSFFCVNNRIMLQIFFCALLMGSWDSSVSIMIRLLAG